MNNRKKIAVLSGDGVGIEVMECALKVLDAIGFEADYEYCDIGWELWKNEGDALPQRTLDKLKQCDCAIMSAITSKPQSEAEKELSDELKGRGLKYSSPIVRLRKELNLYLNLRPAKSISTKFSFNNKDIDIAVFRENTEGLYCGIEYDNINGKIADVIAETYPFIRAYDAETTSLSMRLISSNASRRILHSAFEYARKNCKRCVTIADKPNILRATGGRFVEEARNISREYPDIEMQEMNIDAICMMLVKAPEKFQVIIAENMFGDIISDITSQLSGGMGFAYSANIGDNFALFEPVHGSAPKYAGMNKVNPSAMILSGAFMLEWLGETEMSRRIFNAVMETAEEGKIVTYDIGGTFSNLEMTEEIIRKLK